MDEPMRDLARQTYELLNREELKVAGGEKEQHDYAFVVFSLAKAYEGFLKRVFLDMKMIDRRQYFGEYFRIGRALNPSLPKRLRSGCTIRKRWVSGQRLRCSSPLSGWKWSGRRATTRQAWRPRCLRTRR